MKVSTFILCGFVMLAMIVLVLMKITFGWPDLPEAAPQNAAAVLQEPGLGPFDINACNYRFGRDLKHDVCFILSWDGRDLEPSTQVSCDLVWRCNSERGK